MIRISYRAGGAIASGNLAHARKTGLSLAVPLALLLVSMPFVQPVQAESKKPEVAATDAKQAALLAEIRKNLGQSGRYSATQIEGVIGELRNKSVEEIKAIADFAGKAATGAERLVGPGTGQDARDRVGQLVGSSGGGATAAGNGAQRGVQDALSGGGIRDTRGFTSYASTCAACPDTKSGRNPEQYGESREIVPKGSPNTSLITIYGDGSAKLQYTNGKTEYLNSEHQIVDKENNKVPNATPRPDDQSPTTSTRITVADIKRIDAILGSRSEPDPESAGTGGGIDNGKANRTGTVGLYTESATATYTSKADIQEIIRLSVEKLQGPQVGK